MTTFPTFRPALRPATAALLLAASAAHAGRPLQADDAPVMDPHACELEGVHSAWRSPARTERQTSLQLGCGVGAATELAVQVVNFRAPRELGVSGKTQVFSAPWRDGDAQLSVAWSVAHRALGARWRRSGASLTLVGSVPLSADWTLHANLGHQRDEMQRRRSTAWALAVEHGGLGEGKRWQPMAELFGDDRGRPCANAALRVALVPDQLFVDGSLGRRLGGSDTWLATAGFRLAF